MEYECENECVCVRLWLKFWVMSEYVVCCMECRFITAEEVERTFVDGKVDVRYSMFNV